MEEGDCLPPSASQKKKTHAVTDVDCTVKTCVCVCVSPLQARSKLSQIQESQQEVSKSIEQCNNTLNGTHGGSMTNLADMSETCFSERENGVFPAMLRGPQVRNLCVCVCVRV